MGDESFDQIPDALKAHNLAIRCVVPEYEPELCSGWVKSVEIDPSDIRIDGYGRLRFADHIPTECPECGDRVLEMNGERVSFHA